MSAAVATGSIANPDAGALWTQVGRTLAPPMAPPAEPRSPIQQRRRRGYDASTDDEREAVELVREDGMLRWVWRPPASEQRRGRRAWRSIGLDPRDLVQRLEYAPLGRNQITSALETLDLTLNPARGLRRWNGGAWQDVDAATLAALKGRVLLLVHGTFSRSEMYDSELRATPAGATLFDRVTGAAGATGEQASPYSAVLAFDHATLSMAPWLNALDLVRSLQPLKAELDIVCHSRGGLVVSWALQLAPLPVRQVVFVGSPLMGTSLASPARLREALDLLANVADAVAALSQGVAVAFPPALPLAMGTAGLAKVLGKALHLGAGLPVPDAVVGLVPGLMSQSRVDNNLELRRLFPLPTSARLSGVGVSFQPDEVQQPLWKFWSRFSHLADQARYLGAELVFGQPNDLVVDTDSMNRLGDGLRIPGADFRLLKDRAGTHHCNYFRNAEALDFLERRLR